MAPQLHWFFGTPQGSGGAMQSKREQQDPSPKTEAQLGTRSPRVLLAEDDAAMRALLARTLRRAAFDVVEASSGHEALAWLARSLIGKPPIDLILSDVRMPGYDGLNLLASLRQACTPIPVILITAFGSPAAHAAAARLGAFAMVDKPFDVDDLMILVRAAMRSAPRSPTSGKDQS
jgi:DNA-binding response OmpR family regulator